MSCHEGYNTLRRVVVGGCHSGPLKNRAVIQSSLQNIGIIQGVCIKKSGGDSCPFWHHCLLPRRSVTSRALQPPRASASRKVPGGQVPAVRPDGRPLEYVPSGPIVAAFLTCVAEVRARTCAGGPPPPLSRVAQRRLCSPWRRLRPPRLLFWHNGGGGGLGHPWSFRGRLSPTLHHSCPLRNGIRSAPVGVPTLLPRVWRQMLWARRSSLVLSGLRDSSLTRPLCHSGVLRDTQRSALCGPTHLLLLLWREPRVRGR